jgi:hypothetical protein
MPHLTTRNADDNNRNVIRANKTRVIVRRASPSSVSTEIPRIRPRILNCVRR